MRIWAVVAVLGLLVGCANSGGNGLRPNDQVANQVLSSTSAKAAEALGELHDGIKATGLPDSLKKPLVTNKAPLIYELTVDPSEREDMKKLVPFLVNDEEWQIVGVINHPNGKRSWRFQYLGTEMTRINPLEAKVEGLKRIDIKDLTPPYTKNSKPGEVRDDLMKQGAGKHHNPFEKP